MIPPKTILCPVDFSPASDRAVEYALDLARNCSASLRFLHVSSTTPIPLTHPAPLAAKAGDREQQREPAARDRLKLIENQAGAAGVQAEASVRIGEVYEEIDSAIEDIRPDMVVMGTHGRQGFDHWLLGSVTEGMVRRSAVPVLAVPESSGGRFKAPPHLRRILVATDFLEGARRALDCAVSLSDGAEVRLLHVVPRPELVKETLAGLTALLHEYLERLTPPADPKRFVPEVEIGAPDERILAVAKRTEPDILVVSPHDRGWLERLLTGTTVDSVLRAAWQPVLAVPGGNGSR